MAVNKDQENQENQENQEAIMPDTPPPQDQHDSQSDTTTLSRVRYYNSFEGKICRFEHRS